MSPNPSQHNPDTDDSTAYAGATPPETVVGEDIPDGSDSFGGFKLTASIPWPGSTFIICSVDDGQVITLLDGQIKLTPPGSCRGSMHWECVEANGWLGFRNPVSGKFLGHDKKGNLCCAVDRQKGWESFCVRMTPERSFILLMTHYEGLWQVGIKMEGDVKKLAKMEVNTEAKTVLHWEFIKV